MKNQFIMKSKYLMLIFCLMNVVRLFAIGPFPEKNASWDETELNRQREAGQKLQNDLKKAIKDGKKSFKAQKGIYRFDQAEGQRPCYFDFMNVENFEFDGNNSEFYFEKNATTFFTKSSKNVKIKNLSLDYDPLPFTQGEIIDVDYTKNTVTFRPEKGYEGNVTSFIKAVRGLLFSPADRRLKPKQNGISLKVLEKDENGDYQVKVNGFYGYSAQKCGVEKGDLLVILSRSSRLIITEASENVAFENIDVFASPFVVFVENSGIGGHSYKNCRIIKRPNTNRLISANADGFHSAMVAKGPIIDSCEVDSIGDDFVNFHGSYYHIFEQIAPDEYIVQGFPVYKNNDITLSFLENKTWKFLGERKVVSYETITYTVPENAKAAQNRWFGTSNVKAGEKLKARKIKLDKAVNIETTAIFSCNNAVAGGGIIRNCKFKDSIARGIRLQSLDTIIENNILDRSMGPLLTTGGQPSYWGEATTSANLIVRNNTFIEGNIGSSDKTLPTTISFSAPGPANQAQMVENVTFTNNRILNSGGFAIYIKNAKNIKIEDNQIDKFNLLENPEIQKLNNPITVTDSENINIKN